MEEVFRDSKLLITLCLNTVIEPPKDDQEGLIEEAHCSAYGGHKGITKTYNRLRQKYYWHTLKLDVQNFINRCLACQKKNWYA